MAYLLDTNIVTAIIKKNEKVTSQLREALGRREEVFISCVTYYEIKRGLIATNATRKLLDFKTLRSRVPIVFLDRIEIVETASEIHADLKSRGHRLEDADILIAATAIALDLILVSHDSDMLRVPGLRLEDWLRTDE